MNTLINALQTRNGHTENGMVTNSSTLNFCVDLFASIGAMRGYDKSRITNMFAKAYNENALTAMKILFWSRDIRGGAGERQIFRDILSYLAENKKELLSKNLAHIPEYGRWDDLLCLFNTSLDFQAKTLIADALKSGNKARLILEQLDSLSEEDCQKILDTYQNDGVA